MTASSGVAAAGLAAALAWTAAGSLGPESPHVASLASDLDAKVRETSATVRARAETLAQLPRLEVAVATDAQTIRDLTADELAFRPHAGEIIEIAQIPRQGGPSGPESTPRTMLKIPDRGPDLPIGQSGVRMQIWQGEIHVAAIVPVEPRERARELRGAVAVDRTLDVSQFSSRVRAMGLAARVVLGQSEISLGGISRAGGGSVTMELGASQDQLKLVLQGVPPPPSPLRFLGPFALALVSTGAARLLKRRAPVVELVPAPTAAGPGARTTAEQPRDLPLLQAVPVEVVSEFSNATVPVAAPQAASLLTAAKRSGAETGDTPPAALVLRNTPPQSTDAQGASTLASSLFETDAAPLPPFPPASPNAELDREYRALFMEFVKLRTACRERIDNLDADRFVRVLRWRREELVKTHGPVQVAFRVAFHNGRAAIRLPAPDKTTG